jgi:hypothetical protein
MLFFHAFTGCVVVSAVPWKGKEVCMANIWGVCPEASDVFTKRSQYPPTVEDSDIKVLEKFVVTMYDRSSPTTTIDDTRLLDHARHNTAEGGAS